MMIDEVYLERRRASVRTVRSCKKALSGLMTMDEIATALGVSRQSLNAYAADPVAEGARAIPDDRLQALRMLTGRALIKASEGYADVLA